MIFSNKKRLYVALYPSGIGGNEIQRFHWAFLVGPKDESGDELQGMRYHIRKQPGGWKYEIHLLPNVRKAEHVLVRILIGKVKNESRLRKIILRVPLVQDNPDWRSNNWIGNVLEAIKEDGRALGTAVLDWEQIETAARDFANEKIRAGRFRDLSMAQHPKPTYDMLQQKETLH